MSKRVKTVKAHKHTSKCSVVLGCYPYVDGPKPQLPAFVSKDHMPYSRKDAYTRPV
jgi:hypothetical protein